MGFELTNALLGMQCIYTHNHHHAFALASSGGSMHSIFANLRLALGTEAPIMVPDDVDFYILFVLAICTCWCWYRWVM